MILPDETFKFLGQLIGRAYRGKSGARGHIRVVGIGTRSGPLFLLWIARREEQSISRWERGLIQTGGLAVRDAGRQQQRRSRLAVSGQIVEMIFLVKKMVGF